MTDFPERSAAVLIGLSYLIHDDIDRIPNLLSTQRDIERMETILRLHNLNDIETVSDWPTDAADVNAFERGSVANIQNALIRLVDRTNRERLDFALFYFAGHGAAMGKGPLSDIVTMQTKVDPIGENKTLFGTHFVDGLDEGLAGTDSIVRNRLFVDNTIAKIIEKTNPSTQLVMIFDCCNSGTLADLKFEYYDAQTNTTNLTKKPHPQAFVVSMSGSTDLQLAEESEEGYDWLRPLSVNPNNILPSSGAFTGTLYTLVMQSPEPKVCTNALGFLTAIQDSLQNNGIVGQDPMVCSSLKLSSWSSFFPLSFASHERTAAVGVAKSVLHAHTDAPANGVLRKTLLACHEDSKPGNSNNCQYIAAVISALGAASKTSQPENVALTASALMMLQSLAISLTRTTDAFWRSSNAADQSVVKAAATTIPVTFATDVFTACVVSANAVTYLGDKYGAAFGQLLTNNAAKFQLLRNVFVTPNNAQVNEVATMLLRIAFHSTPDAAMAPMQRAVELMTAATAQSAAVRTQFSSLIGRFKALAAAIWPAGDVTRTLSDEVLAAYNGNASSNVLPLVSQDALTAGPVELSRTLKAACIY